MLEKKWFRLLLLILKKHRFIIKVRINFYNIYNCKNEKDPINTLTIKKMVVFSPQEKLNNHYNTFLRFSGENSLKISENQQKRLKRTKKCLDQLSGARSTQKQVEIHNMGF